MFIDFTRFHNFRNCINRYYVCVFFCILLPRIC